MKQAIAALLVLTLAGCAEWGALKTGVASHGENAADEVRTTAEWTLCQAMTVGAWKRAYGSDPDKAGAWKVLCASDVKATP